MIEIDIIIIRCFVLFVEETTEQTAGAEGTTDDLSYLEGILTDNEYSVMGMKLNTIWFILVLKRFLI